MRGKKCTNGVVEAEKIFRFKPNLVWNQPKWEYDPAHIGISPSVQVAALVRMGIRMNVRNERESKMTGD